MNNEFITLWTPGEGKKRKFISNIRECKCLFSILAYANSEKTCKYSDHLYYLHIILYSNNSHNSI